MYLSFKMITAACALLFVWDAGTGKPGLENFFLGVFGDEIHQDLEMRICQSVSVDYVSFTLSATLRPCLATKEFRVHVSNEVSYSQRGSAVHLAMCTGELYLDTQ